MELLQTKYIGVLTRKKSTGKTAYYVSYRKDGKRIKKCIGEDWTPLKASKERSKLMNETIALNVSMTLTEVFVEYSNSIAHKSDTTRNIGRFKNHIKPDLGSMRMDKITVAHVQQLKNSLSVKISSRTGKILARKSVDDILNLINTIYLYHNRVSDVELKSPANPKKVERYNPDNSRQRYLTHEEIKILHWNIENRSSFTPGKYFKQSVTDNLMMFTKIALTTGARISSILSIQVKDIDFENGVIQISNHKVGGRTYNGYFNDTLSSELEGWCESLTREHYVIGKQTKPLNRISVNRSLQVILDRCFNDGVDDVKYKVVVHTLRHTCFSLLAQKGVSLYIIQKLADHSRIENTQRYAKLTEYAGMEDVKQLFS